MAEQRIIPIDGAKQKIRDLNSKVPNFLKRHPSRVVVERYPQAADGALLAVFQPGSNNFDGPIPTLVHDAFAYLRAALDLAVTAKVLQKGGSPQGVYFPVVHNRDNLEIAIQNALVERAGPEVVSFIRGLEPYPGGDGDALSATCRTSLQLNSLAGRAQVLGYLVVIQGGLTNRRTGGTTEILAPFMDKFTYWRTHTIRTEIDVPIPETDFEVNDEIEATFDISLTDGFPLKDQPVLQALAECAAAVSGALDRFRYV